MDARRVPGVRRQRGEVASTSTRPTGCRERPGCRRPTALQPPRPRGATCSPPPTSSAATSARATPTIAEMLATLGLDSLDALVDADRARRHPPRPRRSTLPAAAAGAAGAGRAARDRRRRTRCCARIIGMGYHDTHTPAVDPAQHPREPGLVHAVHAVPGRDRAGPARGAAQLPDDGRRPDRPAARERLAARRGDRRGRGDGACAARVASSPARDALLRRRATATRRRSPSCGRAPTPLGIEVVRRRPSETLDFAAQTLFGVLRAVPGDRRRRARLRARSPSAPTPRARCVVVATDLLALTLLRAAGRARAPTSRVGTAQRFGVPMGYGGPHAGVPRGARTSTSARCRAASSASRRTPQGKPALPPGAADARAAHPPREGDEQHLHRAGAARGHGRHVRRLPRARGPHARSRARVHALAARARRAACAGSGYDAGARRRSSTRCASTRRAPSRAARSLARARRARHQPARATTTAPSASRSTRPPRPRDVADAARGLRRRRRSPFDAPSSSPRARASTLPGGAARARARSSRTRSSTRYHTETEMLRYMQPARGARPLARALDDPARLVHDEAQRDGRDDAGHLARVRPAAPVRAAPSRRRATRELFARARALARRDHRLRGRLAAAERRRAGRVRRPARRSARYHERARRGAPRRLPDPRLGARHQPGERGDGRHARSSSVACDEHGNIDVADLRGEGRSSTRTTLGGADGHLPVDARRVRGGDHARSARSSTSTAARCTWTART